jgi:hypothetical protein
VPLQRHCLGTSVRIWQFMTRFCWKSANRFGRRRPFEAQDCGHTCC